MNLRSRLIAVTCVAALPLPLVGCGVPTAGAPVVVRDAPRNGAPSDSDSAVVKNTPDGVTNAAELVRRYLKAIAWGNDTSQDPNATDKAAAAAKQFMTTDAQNTWQRGQDITVVRAQINLPTTTANGIHVEVSLQPIGVLSSHGAIDSRPSSAPMPYSFTVVPEEHGRGLRIANPPAGMLLSDEGLDNLYEVQPVYFWDTFNRSLVPDLRYINRSLSPANRLVELTTWLRDGPSESLRPAVIPLPPAIEFKDPRPVLDATPGTARINLSAKAASLGQGQLAKFLVQLRWSLRSLASNVELQIEGQRQELARDAGWDNPAAAPDGQKESPQFAVVDGRVRQLAGDPVAVPALASDDNTGVASAAIIRGPVQQVALVRDDALGRVRLWLGSYNQTAQAAQYTPIDLVADAMSRPVGLTTPVASDPEFLVAAAGKLVAVSVATKQVSDRTPPTITGVTAVSVARDGRRIALVADGRVYAGVLTFDGSTSTPSVSQLEEVQTTLSDAVGVAWSREEWLVVAGRSGGSSALVELTVDGALVEPMSLRNIGGLTVTRVVADPSVHRNDPPRGERGPIMIEANGHAYRVFSGSVDEYQPDPSPAPTPSPSGSPAKQSVASAPFFLD